MFVESITAKLCFFVDLISQDSTRGDSMLMDLRNNWRSGIKDDASSLSTWNNMAERFRNFPVPKWDKDKFLKLLDSRVSFHKEMNVLDIGCGTGIFSIALSKRVAKVIAIDISDKMLEYARLNAEKHQGGNNPGKNNHLPHCSTGGRHNFPFRRAHVSIPVHEKEKRTGKICFCK